MSKKRYPVRIPRFAAGIRAQETRTGSVRSWWAKRWRAVLENMGLRARLGRGRDYAARGQVTKLEIEGNEVRAIVQGSREDPYSVNLSFRIPADEARARIVAALRAQPMIVARLLADDLPEEVEEIFRREKFDLFPGGKLAEPDATDRRYDMTTSCTCPDYANPCKHSCAALILLGEEISRRPATLLELRGIELKELYDED